MAELKFLVLADMHLGTLSVDRHFREIEKLIERISWEHLDFGVICGDLFDYKNYASSEIFRLGVQFLFMLGMEPKTHWYIIEGTSSHDAKQTLTLQTIFDGVADMFDDTYTSRFHFYTKLSEANICGLKCLMIPEEYVVDQDSYYKEAFSHYYDLIFGHGMTDMMYYAEKKKITAVPGAPVFKMSELTSICNYCFFGHVHTHKVEGRFESVGPFTRWEFGSTSAGYDIATYDTEKETISVEYIENEYAPSMETVSLSYEKDVTTDKIDKDLHRLIDYMTREKLYKMRILLTLSDDVEGANGIRIYVTEFLDKYPNIMLVCKQGNKSPRYYEEDGTEIDESDIDPEISDMLNANDDIIVQDYIERKHGEKVNQETIRAIIGYKEE